LRRIEDGEVDSMVLAAFVLADRPDELTQLYPLADLAELVSSDGRRTLVTCLLRELSQPEALPTVAFALGKAPDLKSHELDAMVQALRARIASQDEEFVYQLLIALENNEVDLDPSFLPGIRALGSHRILHLGITQRA
jgi:hypothetical protein